MNFSRPLLLCLLLAVIPLAMAPVAVRATTVVVPDDHATIQSAINSGADLVLVKDGTYAENVTITSAVEVRAHDPVNPSGPIAFPTIDGTLTIQLSNDDVASVIGFRVTGLLTLDSFLSSRQSIRECRLDGGISNAASAGIVYLRGCTVRGSVSLAPSTLEVTNCTFLDTGVMANYEMDGVIRDNIVLGPAPVGIDLNGNDSGGRIQDNLVRDTDVGIIARNPTDMSITGNEVERSTDDGYRTEFTGVAVGHSDFTGNLATDCGGDGFEVSGAPTLEDNVVIRAAGAGVRATGQVSGLIARNNTIEDSGAQGVVSESGAWGFELKGNRVLRAGGNGVELETADTVEDNIVGRSNGDGIVIGGAFSALAVRRNTVYLNNSDGIAIGSGAPAATPVENNILYGNAAFGLSWAGAGVPALACNDYFGNGGPVSGATADPSDVMANPLFCDLPADNVMLASTSPLAGTACGQIGAEGVGCATPAGVPQDGEHVMGFTSLPQPARGTVRLSWAPGDLPARIVAFDAHGARVWTTRVAPGVDSFEWGMRGSSGGILPAGIYFVRFERGAERTVRRVVLAR